MLTKGDANARMRKKSTVTLLVLVVICGLLSFVGTGATASSKTLVVSWAEEMLSLNPVTTQTTVLAVLVPQIWDPLVTRDPKTLELKPALATSWKQVDATTWEFKLRKGVKFHDGQPFDATSVKFTFDTLLTADWAKFQTYLWSQIERVEVIDDYTVRIVTKEPYGPLLANLTMGAMLPPKGFDVKKLERHPIGTGPFQFVEWVRGQKLVLRANPDYWGGKPASDRIIFYPIPENSTRMSAFKKGEVHIVFPVIAEEIPSLQANPSLKVLRVLSCDTHVLSLGGKHNEVFNNPKVREAINIAINRKAICDHILGGEGEFPRSILSPGVFGFNPNLPPIPYDPERAKKLLSEAGYSDGFKAEIIVPGSWFPKATDAAVAISADLAKIGIDAKVKIMDASIAWDTLHAGKFDMFFNSWATMTLDADHNLYRNFHSSSCRENWGDPEVDRLVELGRSAQNMEARKQAYWDLQEYIWKAPYRLPLYHTVHVWGVNAKVRNFAPLPSMVMYLKDVYVED